MVEVIPIVVGALGTVSKCLEKSVAEMQIKRVIEDLQTIELIRSG